MTLFAHGVEPRGVAKIFSGRGWIWGVCIEFDPILLHFRLF